MRSDRPAAGSRAGGRAPAWAGWAVLAGLLLGAAVPAAAQDSRFTVEMQTLIYDTDNTREGEPVGISEEDVPVLLRILRSSPAISRLQLNSSGGSVYYARQISDIVLDFELDTLVHGDCDSACVTVFLAGAKRTMTRGSRIGFHQIYWSRDDIAAYYAEERESSGWLTPFDFAAWLYMDAQGEVYTRLKYYVSRGVAPGFAIETVRNPQGGMWRPGRADLLKAGVLTE